MQTLLEADRLPYALGAQDVHWEEKGAFTGEVSPGMLAALKCAYVIVGHSERRQLFGETDERVARKAKRRLRGGDDADRVRRRVAGGPRRRPNGGEGRRPGQGGAGRRSTREQAAAVVIAYEPIWAIGTGRNASPEDAGQVIRLIRETVAIAAGAEAAAAVRIQYGGSVKAANIREFMAHPEIDGALVGGASLDPEDFALIVKYPS